MKRRVFIQNKLWRDNMIAISEVRGSVIHWRRLNDTEYAQELRTKLLEEAHEVFEAKSHTELVEELADLYEILDILCATSGCTEEEILAAREKKCAERGSFTQQIFVEKAEHLPGSPMEQYCLANPKKYPEIL